MFEKQNRFPLIIDVGRGTYTRKTFSDKRYEIWYNCSDYHNVPTVNGKTQLPGPLFKANQLVYKMEKKGVSLSLDMAKSYPDDAGINTWKRNIRFNRNKNVQWQDNISLKKADSITQHLITCYPAEVKKPGELIIHYAPQGGKVTDFVVHYNASQMVASVEKVKLEAMEDKGIRSKWGDTIHRINFNVKSPKITDQFNFSVEIY